ncbi:PTS sugar transporter [Alkalicoccobacillus murimartini]|uniref:Fructose-specific phosphotransferase system IIC component n=1 Tax=Alkalicoccobacillus murimartini TaxID=171685 RepID=A0ABT9YHU7_9BACI|nr:PTS sugar transporter [Alkalicoccobacillus murimartini]MDQ0207178.1 fructose-specific phosphotransferase system IIC component [Alkalicoccobacillus murimartini]
MKRVIIIASSGGNLYNLGGSRPDRLIKELHIQAEAAGIEVKGIQFIATEQSMDSVKPHSAAKLFGWDEQAQELELLYSGTLLEVNEYAAERDQKQANQIKAGEIDGLIAMSADPTGANKQTVEAAAKANIPVVGTGGTSMATIGSMGARIISQSGTTGTSNKTRAIGFVTSLSKHWGSKYRPKLNTSESTESTRQKVNLRGIMTSSLPAFIALAIVLALSKIPGLEALGSVFDILIGALPVVVAVIAARQIADLDEVSIVAGIVAGLLSVDGGIIGGLLAGIGAGYMVPYLFTKCLKLNFPATTVNIIAGGFGGLIPGLLVFFVLGPIALQVGDWIRLAIDSTISFNPIVAGIVAGLLIWPAIIAGIYHAAILPIVLLEMENTGTSFLGAIDMVGLVMVAAGINLANLLFPRRRGEAAAAGPSFGINMIFGTFVESAYPFMFASKIVFVGALLSAGIGGAIVGMFNLRGTAYVPSFAAPGLSDNVLGFILAMAASLVSAFVFTMVANKWSKSSQSK